MSQDVPIGWHHTSANKATILGNGTLGNVPVAVRALIEAPQAGGAADAPAYIMVGLNGGSGAARSSGPFAFYVQNPHADELWFNATHWGCAIWSAPAVCREPHAAAFGLGAWHALTFAEAPGPAPGARWMSATLDGALLFNVTVSPARNNGTGGFVLLRTGAHRAQFDDLAITSNA